MELLRLGCRVLLSFSNSHITTPQHTADNRQQPYPASINPHFPVFPLPSCPSLRQRRVASPMATRLNRYSTIWWLTPVFLPKMSAPKMSPERRWLREEGPLMRSSNLYPALQLSTNRPRFLPCSMAMEQMFLKRVGACLRVTSRKSRVMTRVWTKRTLLPYSTPFRSPFSRANTCCYKSDILAIQAGDVRAPRPAHFYIPHTHTDTQTGTSFFIMREGGERGKKEKEKGGGVPIDSIECSGS